MFKKPFAIGNGHKVSGADRKKIKKSLDKALGPLSDEILEAVIPAKAGELEVVKLAAPSRVQLYLLDSIPIIIDPSGKGDFLPTIFALWKAPDLLPKVFVKGAPVTQFLIGGADLMLPGVDIPEGLPPGLEKDALVSICVRGNPCPVAVGTLAMSSEAAVASRNGKGKLVEVIQSFGDKLWSELGGSAVPNEGFFINMVMPIGADGAAVEDVREDEEGEVAGGNAGDGGVETASQGLASMHLAGEESHAVPAMSQASSHEDAPSASQATSAADMDSLLEMCLLQALHKSVKDADLPLNSTSLWNGHISPCRPAGTTIDVKKSKHKKMSKFLQAYAKEGLLQVKEDKHSGDVIVVGVNRKCEMYDDYRPYKVATMAVHADAAATQEPGNDSDELNVEEVYKVTREVRPVFESVGSSIELVYSAPEAGEVAWAYVKQKGLDQNVADNRTILLDPLLCDALLKGVIKRGEAFPTHLPKAELRDRFLHRMQLQCRITRGRQQIFKKGAPPIVNISTERRQGNKKVTRIVGIENFLVDPADVASECQRKFASSSTVNDLPGKNAGQEITIQGDVSEKVGDHLAKTYGIPKKFVHTK